MNFNDPMSSPWNPAPSRQRINGSSSLASPREHSNEFSATLQSRTPSNGDWNHHSNGVNGLNGVSGMNGFGGLEGLGALNGYASLPSAPGLTHRSSNLRANASDQDAAALLSYRLDQISDAVNESKDLVANFEREKEIMRQYYSKQITLLQQDLSSGHNGTVDSINRKLQEDNRDLRTMMEVQPFVLALINGSGLSFADDLLAGGEAGGKEAAKQLRQMIRVHVNQTTLPTYREPKIVSRVYADFRSLARSAHFHGSDSKVSDFARGFNSQDLCDFVDVGGSVDKKIADLLDLNMANVHCGHIFLGCLPEDNLIHIALHQSRGANERVTLLETPNPHESLINLGYKVAELNSLLQNFNLEDAGQQSNGRQVSRSRRYGTCTNNVPSGPNGNLTNGTNLSNGRLNGAVAVPRPIVARPPSTSTDQSGAAPKPSPATTWASAVSRAPEPVVSTPSHPPPTPLKPLEVPEIQRNRLGQRIDPVIPHDKEEVERVKRLKMCNMHYLRDECPYGVGCSHKHNAGPTEKEIQTLRLVARMAPCMHGTGCDDPKCIYGHICPAPIGRNGQEKQDRNCIFGAACKFEPEMHRVDRTPVRTVRI